MKAVKDSRDIERARLGWVFEVSLLVMLASGYFALAGSRVLDGVSMAAGALALGTRALHLTGRITLAIPNRWVTVATVIYIGFFAADYLWLSRNFVTATVHLVLFVAVVKLLTAHTARDFLFLKIIAFLELLAAALLSANLSFFFFLVVFVAATVATFASSELLRPWNQGQVITRGVRSFGRRFSLLTIIAAVSILVLTAALFFVLPRTARAALERLVPANERLSGISSEVTLGQPGEIRKRSTALLHVKYENGEPPPGVKYRGGALGEFNGWKWYNSTLVARSIRPERGLFKLAPDPQLRRPGKRLVYQVTARGVATEQIFIAGTPEYLQTASNTIWETPTSTYRLPWVDTEGLRYVAYAYLEDGQHSPPETPRLPQDMRNFYLRLPPVDPRIMQFAVDWTRGLRTDAEKAAALTQHLETRYGYSLEPLERQVDDPLAYFLCERRKGHCEYFASSLAVMLRLLWIPSRVVTGFQSGVRNPVSGWHVIRASDAHTWVEAWIPGKGWVEYDATPADTSITAGMSLVERISLVLDAAETFWQEWVVGYDLDRQVELALEVERSSRQFRWMGLETAAHRVLSALRAPARWSPSTLATAGLVALLGVAIWFLGPGIGRRARSALRLRRVARGESRASDAELLYRDLLEALHRRGLEKPPFMTPLEFTGHLGESPLAASVKEFTLGYYEFRFGGAAAKAPQLAVLLDQIRRTP